MLSKSAVLASVLASFAWGVDIISGKSVGNVAPAHYRTGPGSKAKKNGDGKRMKSGPKPDKMKLCLAKRKGIPGVARGYQNSQGKPVGFNVNGYRGAQA